MNVTRITLLAVLLTLSLSGAAGAGTSLVPFPFIFYTPETELAGGGTVLVYLRGDDTDERPSVISPIFIYTAKKQTMLYLNGEIYLDEARWRLDFSAGYTKFPDTFWGVGNDAPDAREEDFTPERTLFALGLKREVSPALYLGGSFGYARRTMVQTWAGGLIDTAAIPGTRDGNVLMAGLSVTHDDRDSTTFPRAGGYRELAFSSAGGALGGDYDFRSLSLNLSHYRAVGETSVLAGQFTASALSDEPPFDMLGQLGGDMLLRGYYAGRYRDRNLLAAQLELRGHLWRRLGGVLFAGVGEVARDLDGFTLDGLRAAGGFGLRFLLNRDEGLNLRMDWGFGAGSSGFYMSLGEAF